MRTGTFGRDSGSDEGQIYFGFVYDFLMYDNLVTHPCGCAAIYEVDSTSALERFLLLYR